MINYPYGKAELLNTINIIIITINIIIITINTIIISCLNLKINH